MSFLPGGKSKEKDILAKKSQFYVEFLGWMECRGLRGERYTEPVVRELRRRQKKMESPPKLTIQVSRKDLKISQEVEERRRRGIKKIKFPAIPARDITFVHQSSRPENGRLDDIVACIYLGYMPRTQRFVHVHVYRFDQAETAALFVEQINIIVEDNRNHIREVENELAAKAEIDDPTLIASEEFYSFKGSTSNSGSRSLSDEESQAFGNEEIEEDLQSLADVQPFDSVTNELKHRLQLRDAPLLLPPKDYDTISRAHGNLNDINKRRCLNANITGVSNTSRDGNESEDTENTTAASATAETDINNKNATNKTTVAALKFSDNRPSPQASPKLKHAVLPLKDPNNSQLPRKPTDYKEQSHSPMIARRMDLPASPNSMSGSRPNSLEAMQQQAGYVYPPKSPNSPMSPRILHPSQLSRQSSQNSQLSDSSKLSNRSDENRSAAPPVHYKSGPNDDIYAMPVKTINPGALSSDELPPDYFDDDDLAVPQMRHPQGKEFLTQSLPADIIREKLKVGSNSRPNSAELRPLRRAESPIFATAPQQARYNAGMYSPQIQRNPRR